MPQSARKILVTSALFYANGSLHLGHLAHVHAYMGDDQTIHFKGIY